MLRTAHKQIRHMLKYIEILAFVWISAHFVTAQANPENPPEKNAIRDLPTLILRVEDLMHAGQAQRALELLRGFSVDVESDLYPSYLLQLGWVQLTVGNAADAIVTLKAARGRGLESDWVDIYLLQACLDAGERACVDSEFRSLPDEVLREHEGLGQLALRDAMESGNWHRAWSRMSRLLKAAPESRRYRTEGYRLEVLLGLGRRFQESLNRELRRSPLELRPDDIISLLAFAAQNGLTRPALNVSELLIVRLRTDKNSQLSQEKPDLLERAHALRGTLFQEQDYPKHAGEAFATAAAYNPKWHYAASRAFQIAGLVTLSEFHAQLIPDRQKQLEQRAILRLRQGEYDKLAAMERSLLHAGLLTREDIRYAVAYAHFQHYDFDDARRLLTNIQDARLFEKATALRAEMQRLERKTTQ